MLNCKNHKGDGICEKVGRPASDWFCKEICKGREEIWSKWLKSIQSKIPPDKLQSLEKNRIEQEKAIAELPSRALQFEHIRKHAVEIAKYRRKTGRVFVNDKWKAKRLKLGCKECEKLRINPKNRKWWCGCCGCNVVGLVGDKVGKADFEALTCVAWTPIDAQFLAELPQIESAGEGNK